VGRILLLAIPEEDWFPTHGCSGLSKEFRVYEGSYAENKFFTETVKGLKWTAIMQHDAFCPAWGNANTR